MLNSALLNELVQFGDVPELMKIIQERLGHSDNLNTYSHVLSMMPEEATEKMDEILVPTEVSEVLKKVNETSHPYADSSKE